MVRVRVKESNSLQKPWVSPRFRMARSGQGRQRLLSLFSPWQGKKGASSSFSQNSKRVEVASDFWCDSIRTSIRCRMSCTWGPGFPITGTIRACSIAARTILARLLLKQVWGLGIPASSSLPSLVPPKCLRFFFSSITGATQTCLVVVRAKLKDLSSLCISLFFFFLVSLWLQACLSPFMYIVLSLFLIKDDFIAFYVSFLFYNNYLVNGCAGVFSFEPYLEPMPSSVKLLLWTYRNRRAQQCRL